MYFTDFSRFVPSCFAAMTTQRLTQYIVNIFTEQTTPLKTKLQDNENSDIIITFIHIGY